MRDRQLKQLLDVVPPVYLLCGVSQLNLACAETLEHQDGVDQYSSSLLGTVLNDPLYQAQACSNQAQVYAGLGPTRQLSCSGRG